MRVLLSSRKTLTARANCNAMAEHRGATGLPLTVWRSKAAVCCAMGRLSDRAGTVTGEIWRSPRSANVAALSVVP